MWASLNFANSVQAVGFYKNFPAQPVFKKKKKNEEAYGEMLQHYKWYALLGIFGCIAMQVSHDRFSQANTYHHIRVQCMKHKQIQHAAVVQ